MTTEATPKHTNLEAGEQAETTPLPEAADKPNSGSADERRKHRRYLDRPLNIKIDKQKFEALDWSMGGFRFYPDGLDLAQVNGQISGRRVKGSFSGEVVNVRDNGEIGVRFHNISKSLMSALGGYAAARSTAGEPSPLRHLWFLVAAAAFLGFLFLMV